MKEMIDIYDANLKHLGVEDRVKAHLKGLWHITYHFWLISPNNHGKVLFQWRAFEMENFPDMLDVSAAGHLTSGENVSDGIREVEEELGINLTKQSDYDLGYRVEVADQDNGQKNREYQSVHMYISDKELNEFSPQLEEVSGLYWIPITEGMDLFQDKIKNIECEGMVYSYERQKWEKTCRVFSKNKFLPRIQNYYLTILIMAERILNGDSPLSIS